VQHPAGVRAEGLPQRREGRVGQVADGLQTTRPGGTSTSPSGFAAREATLATNFDGPMPTEQVMSCSSATTARIRSPMAAGGPNIRTDPVRSRKASSIDADSTVAETVAKTAVMERETAV
jgi:hypothetical protein